MADIYCEGTVHAFVLVQGLGAVTSALGGGGVDAKGNANKPQGGKIQQAGTVSPGLYLGTCEEMPKPEMRWFYEPAMSDIVGRMTEDDFSYAGMKAVVTLNLTKWSESVLRILKSPPFYTTDGLRDGLTNPGARGSLTYRQFHFYTLWLVNDFWLAPQLGAPGDLNPGLYFGICRSLSYSQPRGGTAPAMRILEVGALDGQLAGPATRGNLTVPAGGFACWSEDAALFPSQDQFNSLLY